METLCGRRFSILLRKNDERFLNPLNAMADNITFTVERERDGKLLFLDVSVKWTEKGLMCTSVCRKDTHKDGVLNFHSNHARSAKTAVVRALIGRVRTRFSHRRH